MGGWGRGSWAGGARGRGPSPPGPATAGVREEFVRPLFAQDFDDGTYAAAAGRLTRQNEAVFGRPATRAAWREVPSTYVVCGEDRATLPETQRAQAARATDVVELPVAHHPFVTRPDLVAGVLLRPRPRG
ncbi:alpha/beta fold hydrolase [Amycolatopsis sp. NPDC058278]|uniref:alpha/beta fold hydrolase n=1 Tax=Amycolatopsis sp. NPDC058278 TaxID=3346417 RepID=UPI0036D9288D